MKLDAYQKFVISSIKARVKVGLLLDLQEQAREKEDWKEVLEIKKKLKGYQNYAINGTGERGIGKTEGTIEAFTMAGIPVILQYPAQWVDNSDAVGMPKVREVNGVEVTKNLVRDFFPRIKTDEKGNKMIRKDGGYMIDFESVKEYIANYEELMVYYEGDINQAPGLGMFWDEINRIIAQDVQQLMFSVMLNQKLGEYSFPNPTLFVAASNPNTGDYNVTALMEEEAFKDRFVQITVESSLDTFNAYMQREEFHWSVKALANHDGNVVKVDGDYYNLGVKPSNRSLKTLSSIMKFTDVQKDLEKGDFQEVVAGLMGDDYAGVFAGILENGSERVPTGDEIITDYDTYRELVQSAGDVETGRQDIINQVKDNFLNTLLEEGTLEKYKLKPEKGPNGERIIHPNLENIYKLFQDVPADIRVLFVETLLAKQNKILSAFSLHVPLYELVEKDVISARKKQVEKAKEKVMN